MIRLLALLLLLAASPAFAQSAKAIVTVEGVFTILRGDPDPAVGGPSKRIYRLNTDDGGVIELDLAGAALPPGGIAGLVNKRIQVVGEEEAPKSFGAAPRVKARSVTRMAVPAPKVSGNQKYITILCKFAGNAAEPRAPSYFLTQLGNTSPGFNHYFREASYDSLTLDGSAVASAWVSLPQPRTFYFDGVKTSGTYLRELWEHCTTAALPIVNFSTYYGINLMFNDKLDDAAWGGGQSGTLNGVTKGWPSTWMPYSGESNNFGWRHHGVLAHEMSHSFGAPHSGSPDGYEYGSLWDVVSSPGATCTTSDTNYGCIGQSMNAYAKTVMEVMPAARIATHNGGTATYDIERLAQPQNAAGTYQMVRINIAGSTTRNYTVESRFRVGYDAQLPGDGVIIHQVDETREVPAWLVAPSGMQPREGGSGTLWLPGMTFRSQADNVMVTVNSFSATGTANVTVAPYAAASDTWPTSCAMPAGFTTPSGATGGWSVDTSSAAVGTCSLKSSAIATPTGATRNRADTEYTGTFAAGNVTFFARVSSEATYDCLRFLIDNAEQNVGSCTNGGGLGLTPAVFSTGARTETGWRFFSFPITAGTHTLRWSYEKDEQTAGLDAAWIDSLVLPISGTFTLTVAKAGSGSGTVTSSPAGINCGSTCSAPFSGASAVTLTAAPSAGSVFTGWSGGGCSGTGGCTLTLNAATTVTATFAPSFALTVTKAGTGTGSVSSSPAGIDCGATCSASFASGTAVSLTATPAAGSTFAGWSGACSGTGACSVTMSAAAAVTATFTASTTTFALTVTKSGTGSGTVSSSPAGIDCGSTCSASFAQNTVVTLTATPSTGSAFTGWSGACSGSGTCSVTMAAAASVGAAFASGASITASASSLAFGGQSMRTTTPSQTVTFTNAGGSAVTVSSLAATTHFGVTHNCTSIAAGGNCAATVTFTPLAEGALTGTLTLTAGTTTVTVSLTGTGERSLVTHYYRSILRRDADAGGKAFWESEATRVQGLGANVNEVWFALAQSFYFSAEYLGQNRSNDGYVTDLYNTFFNRTPDAAGLAYWTSQLSQGLAREHVLMAFMFSTEFTGFTQAIFGTASVRKEIDTVVDFYRGLLARLPDSAGFAYWLGQFRTAQCQGGAAVNNQVEAISSAYANSPEYTGRNRSDVQFMSDIYNAFMRRAGDLAGVQFWIGQLQTGALTRDAVRRTFIQTPEFQARVAQVIAQGCMQ